MAKRKTTGATSGSMGIGTLTASNAAAQQAASTSSKPAPEPTPVKIEQWSPAKDDAYANAVASGDMATAARLVAERDALVAANEAFHRANATGPYASTGSGGGGAVVATGPSPEQQQAISIVQGLFSQYGLSSLFAKIKEYAMMGYEAETIAVLLRDTPEYKQRFPAMAALNAKGRGISEAAYVEYETNAVALERKYGLPTGMLTNNVTNLLTNEVSADELSNRVVLSSAASVQAPQDFKDQMQKYYNIDSGGLAGYFLDPTLALPLLEKQYAAAQIGTEATRQQIDLGLATAEQLQGLGVTQEEARTGFGTVAGAKGLSQGRGDTISQEQMIQGTLAKNAAAQQEMQRVASSKVGAFQGAGGYLQTQQGNVGLGSAATR